MNKISNWLTYKKRNRNFSFEIIDVTEHNKVDQELIAFLQEKIIFSYRTLDFYKHHFGNDLNEKEIKSYLIEQILPKNESDLDKIVRQGDWGEIFAQVIVSEFTELSIPSAKLRWKINKDKSVFGTDLIAFNDSDTITDIYYFEIKTRYKPNIKEGTTPNRHYIPTIAHQSLLKDAMSPTESIFNYLQMQYYEKEDYNSAKKYSDLVKNSKLYSKIFEIFLILEKSKYQEKILEELENLPPSLSPLNVTIVLIDNLQELVTKTWDDIENTLVSKLRNLPPT
ncbi:Hachiman antiphage defense system protein HamA [Leptospira bourretii]|uniref:Hachiman antiphage defense system protein HamA n=2 Tax=Leptospira bourretii TaxID=2484962 RepID=UPI0014385297|nr:Hachiman antiphage defense system protein HamA [Leptospira bourretii]